MKQIIRYGISVAAAISLLGCSAMECEKYGPEKINGVKVLSIENVTPSRMDYVKIVTDGDGREVRFSPGKWNNQIKIGDTVDLVVMEEDCTFSDDSLEGLSIKRHQ